MNEVIDIYTKLIIAIISFIAPLIIHLLSMFSDATAHIKKRHKIQLSQMDELFRKQVQEAHTEQMSTLMQKSQAVYNKRENEYKTQQNVLNPKRQISRIFPVLFISLIFIAIYQLIHNSQSIEENVKILLSGISLLLSLMCAVAGVSFLKTIAWTVIDIKQELADEKTKKEIEEKAGIVSQ